MPSGQMMTKYAVAAEHADPLWVCTDCLGDEMLKSLLQLNIQSHDCCVCLQTKYRVVRPVRIANFIGPFLPSHYFVYPDAPPDGAMKLEDIVADAIESDSKALCTSIAKHLTNQTLEHPDFYRAGQVYLPVPSPLEIEEDAMEQWRNIAIDLVQGRRFFNERAREFFESLIKEALDAREPGQHDLSAVVLTHPQGTSFYRARIARNIAEAEQFAQHAAKELGAPPKDRTTNSRMSASGVSLLYVSEDTDTCVSEIRPAIGDTIAIGRFVSTTPMRFFDFRALSRELEHQRVSKFDSDFERKMSFRRLLQHVQDEIARPVRVHDQDYVVTQALAEFIRYHKEEKFDGIAFRSVQRSEGINYVIFNKPENRKKLMPPTATPKSHLPAIGDPDWRPTFDMAIDSKNVSIHQVTGVSYSHQQVPFWARKAPIP